MLKSYIMHPLTGRAPDSPQESSIDGAPIFQVAQNPASRSDTCPVATPCIYVKLQAIAAIYDSGFELLPHAPYSPDLAPSDFHLFPHMKKSLSGIHFRSDEEVIDAVTSFFESLGTSFFLESIKGLEHRWKKCIDLKGDYVEK
ncbi:hypothetical protein LAZ67_12002425 [Cordylochernes scorpioides]|uniref:Histone-lysine N-methyltransferase SETMAR n=1 Tax=Cordylochernes scorpioides TaxID=51811 RepID=A0ABY6L1R4_9ARAC|nr:hypothetical protein LAZ67_12002425 [Cordylochernes scorpioides]